MEVPESSIRASILFSVIRRWAFRIRACRSSTVIGTTSPVMGFRLSRTAAAVRGDVSGKAPIPAVASPDRRIKSLLFKLIGTNQQTKNDMAFTDFNKKGLDGGK